MNITQKKQIIQIEKHKKSLLTDDSSRLLTQQLSSARFQKIIHKSKSFRNRVYSPLQTILIFIKQVLNPDKSCKQAVSNVVAEKLSQNEEAVSANTGPYCKARQRLSEEAVHELVKETAQLPEAHIPMEWRPYGRELKTFDGSTVIMADTKANQGAFPQHANQKKGIGFPIARILVAMSLTTGTILDYAIDAHKGKGTGESSLLRRIFDCISKDDIALGDRYFPSFFLMADLKKKKRTGFSVGKVSDIMISEEEKN